MRRREQHEIRQSKTYLITLFSQPIPLTCKVSCRRAYWLLPGDTSGSLTHRKSISIVDVQQTPSIKHSAKPRSSKKAPGSNKIDRIENRWGKLTYKWRLCCRHKRIIDISHRPEYASMIVSRSKVRNIMRGKGKLKWQCLETFPGYWDWRNWHVVVTVWWVDVEKKRDDWIFLTFPRWLRLLSKRHQWIDRSSSVYLSYDNSKYLILVVVLSKLPRFVWFLVHLITGNKTSKSCNHFFQLPISIIAMIPRNQNAYPSKCVLQWCCYYRHVIEWNYV